MEKARKEIPIRRRRIRVKKRKRKREKGCAERRENLGKEGGKAGIVAPCLA